jgi:hypothetical protein
MSTKVTVFRDANTCSVIHIYVWVFNPEDVCSTFPRNGGMYLQYHTAAYYPNNKCFIYCISTVNTQHMQRPDVLVQPGYIWRHISAVKRPSLGQLRIALLLYYYYAILCWPKDGRLKAETCRQI